MKLTDVDDVLLRYADTESAQAISFRLKGEFTPEWVAHRIVVLLDTPDWLTAAQQDQLITQKMRIAIARMGDLKFTTRTAEVLINSLEKLGSRLDKRAEATEADLHKLYAFQGSVLVDSLEEYDAHMRKSLGINKDEWDRHKETAIRAASQVIERHEDGFVEPEATEAELVYESVEIDADDLDTDDYGTHDLDPTSQFALEQPEVMS
jgi:hypothetical protein